MSIINRLHTNIDDVGVFAALAVVFSALKWLTSPAKQSLKSALVNIAVALPIGILAGGTALELGHGDFVSMSVSSFATYMSREFLDFLRDRRAVKDLAQRAAENLVDRVTK